jgi:hypothetical protein
MLTDLSESDSIISASDVAVSLLVSAVGMTMEVVKAYFAVDSLLYRSFFVNIRTQH